MEWLPEQTGLCDPAAGEVSWYKNVMLNRTYGESTKASFFCVRLSPNGRDCRQLCDPTDIGYTAQLQGQRGRNTGVIRAAIEGWWNDLKRGHFIDVQTRVLTMQLQCKSNNIGIRNRLTIMFEFTSPAGVLPSYDMETMVLTLTLTLARALALTLALTLALILALTLTPTPTPTLTLTLTLTLTRWLTTSGCAT